MSNPAPPRPASRKKNREYDLLLYVAGATPKSTAALRNLEQICQEHLAGRYHIEIIDLMKNPQFAQSDQILAVPTLVRKEPMPIRKIVGNLSQTARVLAGLDISPIAPASGPSGKDAAHAG